MNTKLGRAFLVISMLGVIAFWAFGFNGRESAAVASFFVSGAAGMLCLISESIAKLRRYRRGF